MLSSKALKDLVAQARPIIERQLDDAERIAGFRDVVASNGGDWSALKALIKAQIQDERDDAGDGKRVRKILEKANFSTDYAELLGWSNMNERNFSHEVERPDSREDRAKRRASEAMDDHKALSAEAAALGLIDHDAHAETVRIADAIARKYGAGVIDPLTGEVFDGEANAKLIATVAAGVQTEVGRKALVAALDIMIEREETTVGGDESGTASEFDRPATPAASGGRPSEPSSVAGGAKMDDRSSDDPGRLGDAPILTSAKTEPATNPIPADVPAFLTRPAKPLRPHCLRPEMCASSGGDRHCHACLKAMQEEAA